MKNFVTPHCHPQSLDSGSTVKKMVQREVELVTGYGTITDHGSMAACLAHYEACKEAGIKPILGLEGYFRDDDCSILKNAGLLGPKKSRKGEVERPQWAGDYLKYFHITMHFLNQEAYLTAGRLLSKADLERGETHGQERKPLFTWNDLEELGGKDVTFCSSCLMGVVQRHLMNDRRDLAEAYYNRIRSIVKPGNFYVEVFPHKCTHNWENKVLIKLEGGQEEKFYPRKLLLVDGVQTTAEALYNSFSRKENYAPMLDASFHYSKKEDVGKRVVLVERRHDFFQNAETPMSPKGDIQFRGNLFVMFLAKKYGDPIIMSDDAHYATPDEKLVQDSRLGNGAENWKFYGNYHRMTTEEAAKHFLSSDLNITQKDIDQWVENSYAWASRFDNFELKFEPQLPVRFYPQDSLLYMMGLIKKHGRFNPNDPEMVARFRKELDMLTQNGKLNLLPYFFPLEEAVSATQEHGLLTGPGRGSAAGLLLSYLIGITHVNPLKYKLSMERFITIDRIVAGTLPDIDQDLEDRTFLVGDDGQNGWLQKRFGQEYVAQISTDTMLRLKSSIKDVHRAQGTLTKEIEDICKKLPNPPQGIEDYDFIHGKFDEHGVAIDGIDGLINQANPALMSYINKFPEQWKIVEHMLGIPRNKSRHACAVVICDKPVNEFLPLTMISGIPSTQYTAKWVEKAGGIKIDFLTVNSLKDIRNCLDLVRERSAVGATWPDSMEVYGKKVPKIRLLPFNNGMYDIWDLPEDQAVFKDIVEGDTETVFQLNTQGAVQYLKLFTKDGQHLIQSIEDIATFTALDRPGPLDFIINNHNENMLHEFVNRTKGNIDRLSPYYSQYLFDFLPETHGVLVYQEQLQKVVEDLGGFTPLEANEFRINVAKKKKGKLADMQSKFMAGAVSKVGEEEAQKIWSMMITFGQYGFNKSHAVCYSIIAYACAFLKHYYPLEWWTAVLRNAKKDEVSGNFWKFCGHLIETPDINRSGDSFVIDNDKILAPISLIEGIGPKAHEAICESRPYKNIDDFVARVNRRAVNKSVAYRLIFSGVMDSIFEKDTIAVEKLTMFEAARAKIANKKPESLPEQYLKVTPLQRYCVRKGIIPIYTSPEKVIEMFMKSAPLPILMPAYNLSITKEGVFAKANGRGYILLGDEKFREADHNGTTGDVAVVAYIVKETRFTYANNAKEALKLICDVDGYVFEVVRWPSNHEGADDENSATLDFGEGFTQNVSLEGSLVLLYLNRWKPEKGWTISSAKFIAGIPLGEAEQEEN